jgi:hypothetical protein
VPLNKTCYVDTYGFCCRFPAFIDREIEDNVIVRWGYEPAVNRELIFKLPRCPSGKTKCEEELLWSPGTCYINENFLRCSKEQIFVDFY